MRSLFKNIIYICCFSLCYSTAYSQDNTKQQAIAFSNKMSVIVKGLYDYGMEWGKKFSHIDSTSRKYAELKPIRLRMEKFATEKLAEVKATKDVNGSETFRTAMIQYLEAEKKLLDKGFIPIESLGTNASPEQMQKAVNNLSNESKKEESYLKKIRDAQAVFARRNGFNTSK